MDQRKRGLDQLTSSLSPNDCEIAKALIKEIKNSRDKIDKLNKIDYRTRTARLDLRREIWQIDISYLKLEFVKKWRLIHV